jgi:hypothetical protein
MRSKAYHTVSLLMYNFAVKLYRIYMCTTVRARSYCRFINGQLDSQHPPMLDDSQVRLHKLRVV